MKRIFVLLLGMALALCDGFAQHSTYYQAMLDDDIRLAQRPGTETLLRDYLAPAAAGADTVTALFLIPAACPRCEAVIPHFLQTMRAVCPAERVVLVSCFDDPVAAARYLRQAHPDFRFRFVLTVDASQLAVPAELEAHFLRIGRVDIAECPSLYEQCDVMFQPTLLECFSATYPEAMRMRRPIVTTDIEFAHGLCGDAAVYYDALSPQAAAEAIYRVATERDLRARLVAAGTEQLKRFDTYTARAEKLIRLVETEFRRAQTQK